MKAHILLTFCFLSVLSLKAQPAFPVAATPDQAISYFFDGLAEVDDSKMRAYVTKDFLLLEDGVVWNTDSLSASMGSLQGVDFKRTNTFQYIDRDVAKDKVILVYHNRADILYNGKAFTKQWLESAVVIPDGKRGWKIKMLHSTKLTNEAKK